MKMTIVDVRSSMEYEHGHVNGSINIPLHEIPGRLEEFKALPQPVVLCCASGNRSGQASVFLNNQGIKCENGGSWIDVEYNYHTN